MIRDIRTAKHGISRARHFIPTRGFHASSFATSWLCVEFARHANSGDADFKPSSVPRFSKSLCILGEAAIHDSLDAIAVRSAFDEWIAEHDPKHWPRALVAVFREAFAMRSEGLDCEAILKSLHEMVGA
jgi:hypothetical protein